MLKRPIANAIAHEQRDSKKQSQHTFLQHFAFIAIILSFAVAGLAPALLHILVLFCNVPLSGRVFSPRRTAKSFSSDYAAQLTFTPRVSRWTNVR